MQKDNNTEKKYLLGFIDKKNLPHLIISLVLFLVIAVISFFDVASNKTVLSYSISEYEIGQIADKTIIAEKTLLSTPENPTSVEKGEKVTRKGFPITQLDYDKLVKMAETPGYIDYRSFADNLLFFIILLGVSAFLFSKSFLGKNIKIKDTVFIAVLFALVYAVAIFCQRIPSFEDAFNISVIIPSSLCVMLIAVLVGQKEAVCFTLLSSMSILQAAAFEVAPALFALATGLGASRIVRKMDKRIDFIFAAFILSILNIAFSILTRLIFNASEIFNFAVVLGLLINGIVSGVFALGLLTPLESLMNTASVFRLMDLSDVNNSIMRKLLLEASGTYNHSMMVATLSETACAEIGANPLLARVASYYHDIGKMEQPEYFTENQSDGVNPLVELNPSLSVSVIRRHVKKGVEKVTQMHFPKEVIDIIDQHHGTSIIQYFYNKALEENPNVSPEEYSYIGTKPQTREAAVVMLADTVEAACHSLKKPTAQSIEKFVHTLINAKYESGQLNNAQLTFLDLEKIENTFVPILTGYYHSRIAYPNQKEADEAEQKKGAENE